MVRHALLARHCVLTFVLLFFSSCASAPKNIQPQINSLVIAQHFDRALQFLDEGPLSYGPHNELLYWLDRGLLLHLAGRPKDSIGAFEHAKKTFDALYSRSLAQAVSTVVGNDYWDNYRGEDYEYVLVNIFQALNFALLGNIDEALVEARDVDHQLKLINDRYSGKAKNVYRDDAFAQLLMGLLYEAQGSSSSIDDARICYTKAQEVYGRDYAPNYGVSAPHFLQERLRQLGPSSKAQVYLVQYMGFVPVKVAEGLILPLDRSHVTQFSFPQYSDRFSEVKSSMFSAKGPGAEFVMPTVVGQPIGAIAKQILNNRKAWVIAKGAIRPALKYAAQVAAEEGLRKGKEEVAADVLNILGNIYNLATEQPDLRGWQTLPNEIRMARLELEPGPYEFFVEDLDESKIRLDKKSLGSFVLKPGEKKFLVARSFR